MNILVDPILTLSGGTKVSLAGLFAAMARGEARGFPALRPHQRPAWHMFLVQLGALALRAAGRADPPRDEGAWTALLRGLTPKHGDDSPWRLVAEDRRAPAFLQPPAPDGLKWSEAPTPDALDMLITSRNHDLKQAVARSAAPEDWVYALVSLQTCEGYGGRGNNGIARMNGGSSSRPLLGLAPARAGDVSIDPSAWWRRDLGRLLAARAAGELSGLGTPGGPALLWLLDWPEGKSLDLRDLDPWFIEVCRRVRLAETPDGGLVARRANSTKARIDAKAFNGATGDPWAPVEKTAGKSLTLSGGDFDYKRLCDLMFSGNWERPLLADLGQGESGDMLLVAEAFSRGNSKTEGFKSRIVPAPEKAARLFASEPMAKLAEAQIAEIAGFDKALAYALALTAAGGDRDAVGKKHYERAGPARRRFDRAADRLFFPSLWRRAEADGTSPDAEDEAKRAFLVDLLAASEGELETALPAVPCAAMSRPRAEARARRAFRGRVWNSHPELFQREEADDASA